MHGAYQADGAGGQLASVVDSASSFFGFLNPFSWFAPKPKEEPPTPAADVEARSPTKAAASPPKTEAKKEPPKKMTADELRTKLRPVFDKFDADQVICACACTAHTYTNTHTANPGPGVAGSRQEVCGGTQQQHLSS